MRRLVLVLTATLILAGCAPAPAEPASSLVPTAPAADEIASTEDGIEWARSLDSSATPTELSTGIGAISDLVPSEDIWFQTNNKLGQALIRLNAEVLDDPENAGTKVDDLQSVIDDLEEAIAHGNKP